MYVLPFHSHSLLTLYGACFAGVVPPFCWTKKFSSESSFQAYQEREQSYVAQTAKLVIDPTQSSKEQNKLWWGWFEKKPKSADRPHWDLEDLEEGHVVAVHIDQGEHCPDIEVGRVTEVNQSDGTFSLVWLRPNALNKAGKTIDNLSGQEILQSHYTPYDQKDVSPSWPTSLQLSQIVYGETPRLTAAGKVKPSDEFCEGIIYHWQKVGGKDAFAREAEAWYNKEVVTRGGKRVPTKKEIAEAAAAADGGKPVPKAPRVKRARAAVAKAACQQATTVAQ